MSTVRSLTATMPCSYLVKAFSEYGFNVKFERVCSFLRDGEHHNDRPNRGCSSKLEVRRPWRVVPHRPRRNDSPSPRSQSGDISG